MPWRHGWHGRDEMQATACAAQPCAWLTGALGQTTTYPPAPEKCRNNQLPCRSSYTQSCRSSYTQSCGSSYTQSGCKYVTRLQGHITSTLLSAPACCPSTDNWRTAVERTQPYISCLHGDAHVPCRAHDCVHRRLHAVAVKVGQLDLCDLLDLLHGNLANLLAVGLPRPCLNPRRLFQ